MKKNIFLVLICTSFGLWLSAQSFSPSVVSAAGAMSKSSKLSLEWTLGELAIDFVGHEDIILTEGFHQTFLKDPNFLTEVEEVATTAPISFQVESNGYNIKVWPNPVRSIISIKIETVFVDDVYIEFLDLMGRKLKSTKNSNSNQVITLDLSPYTPGLYFLKVLKSDGSLIKTILTTKQ